MLDKEVIEKIAKLARLSPDNQEVQALSEQLTKALAYFQQISSINTQNIEPLITPTQIDSYWREDVVSQSTVTEKILENAPDKVGNLFRVPPVV